MNEKIRQMVIPLVITHNGNAFDGNMSIRWVYDSATDRWDASVSSDFIDDISKYFDNGFYTLDNKRSIQINDCI